MTGRMSALALLCLGPGADAAAIERAYKRLIKLHHPDREGGDARRAAEITRAFRELRGGSTSADPLQFNDEIGNGPRRRWRLAAAFAIAGIGAAVFVVGPSVPLTRTLWAEGAQLPASRLSKPDPIDGELHVGAIDAAVGQALQLFRTRDEAGLADASRDCARRFRDNPGTRWLDRCAAFDDAVAGLEDRDPLSDDGPFAPLAVTGRQWSAASALSDDNLAIDARLHAIRLRVEILLAPPAVPVAPPTKG